MCLLVAAPMAMQLFGYTIPPYTEQGAWVPIPFDSIQSAFLGLYQLVSGENWYEVLSNVLSNQESAFGSALAGFFLVFWYSFANCILLNLFVAATVENFELSDQDKLARQVQDFKQKYVCHDENLSSMTAFEPDILTAPSSKVFASVFGVLSSS